MSEVPEIERMRADHGIRWTFWLWAGLGAALPLFQIVSVVIWSLIDRGPEGVVQGLGWLFISIPFEIAPPVVLFLCFGLFYRTKIYANRMGTSRSSDASSIVAAALIIGILSSLFYGFFPLTVTGMVMGGLAVAATPMVIALTGLKKERKRQLTTST